MGFIPVMVFYLKTEFAELVGKCGIKFIGYKESMELLGNKSRARKLMIDKFITSFQVLIKM